MSAGTSLKSILILDDDADFRKLLVTILGNKFEGVALIEYDPVAEGVPGKDYNWSKYDVLLLDYYLCIHNVTGLDILQNNRKNKMFPATIMLTGAGNEEVAVRAIKAGVHDYLRKETLDKDHLHVTILDAFEKHKLEQERLNELTHQSHAFNKALFYQELEQKNVDEINRVLILIELDNHEILEQRLGIILRDNIIRHIAKQSFEIFKLGDCNPSITRFGDTAIALLIDDPGSRITLEFNLRGLCTHLKKHPYKFEAKKIRTTISLGTLCLSDKYLNADEYIKHARAAVNLAANEEGNSFYIYTDTDWEPAKDQPEATEKLSIAEKTASEKGPEIEHKLKAIPSEIKPEPEPALEPEPELKPKLELKPKPEAKPAPDTEIDLEVKPQTEIIPDKPGVPVTASGKPEGPTKPAKKPLPVKDDAELENMALSESSRKIKIAFDEKRTVQTFQPVISLFSEEDDHEIYIVAVQLINKDGTIMDYDDIKKETNIPAFRKFIDKWMLREVIGRIINRDNEQHVFFLNISKDSLADATFFNWLRKLLTGLENRSPGKQIVLEMSAREIKNIQKQAGALMSYLKKSHGFRFILGQSSNTQEIRELSNSMHFDLIRTNFETISEMSNTYPETGDSGGSSDKISVLQHFKKNGIHFIADDVEDATRLTETISVGADYASGLFIGEPLNQLDDVTNVESFEII